MESRVLISFLDELEKIAEGNVADPVKPAISGASNIVAKAPSTPGIPKAPTTGKAQLAKPTNYSIVNSNAPMAVTTVAAGKAVPPPPIT
jgi:hypothetical protein